jgi:YesN/AraC family two-component response regulator
MDTPFLLCIDLRGQKSQPEVYSSLAGRCQIQHVSGTDDFSGLIRKTAPHVLCFDYDYPDIPGLKKLQDTKLDHPSLPILMLTEQHSEALAIWALRTRVWDYLVKPVSAEDLYQRITILSELATVQYKNESRTNLMPQHLVPAEMRTHNGGPASLQGSLQPALSYMHAHFHEKMPLTVVAKICGMEPFKFSRSFKRNQGMTFREFIIRLRINKAAELLRNSDSSVLDVAYAVGFNDHSHFARMFRRYVGVPPSIYGQHNKPR